MRGERERERWGRMSNGVIKRHRDTGREGDEWGREQENWTGGGE